MTDRSDTVTFELLAPEPSLFGGAAETPFGSGAGDITKMSAASLAAAAASARKSVALPALQPARYRPVRLSRSGRRS